MSIDAFPDLRALAENLRDRQLVATAASERSTVYGYIRTSDKHLAYIDACEDLLTWWCVAEGWRLGCVFRDTGVDGNALVRPGFTALLDALQVTERSRVVVVHSTHLSPCLAVAKRLRLALRRVGATCCTLTDAVGSESAPSATGR